MCHWQCFGHFFRISLSNIVLVPNPTICCIRMLNNGASGWSSGTKKAEERNSRSSCNGSFWNFPFACFLGNRSAAYQKAQNDAREPVYLNVYDMVSWLVFSCSHFIPVISATGQDQEFLNFLTMNSGSKATWTWGKWKSFFLFFFSTWAWFIFNCFSCFIHLGFHRIGVSLETFSYYMSKPLQMAW